MILSFTEKSGLNEYERLLHSRFKKKTKNKTNKNNPHIWPEQQYLSRIASWYLSEESVSENKSFAKRLLSVCWFWTEEMSIVQRKIHSTNRSFMCPFWFALCYVMFVVLLFWIHSYRKKLRSYNGYVLLNQHYNVFSPFQMSGLPQPQNNKT